jgi:HSP20 family protein
MKGVAAMSTLAPVKRESKAVRPWFRANPLNTVREEMEDLMKRVFGEGEEVWPFGRIAPSLDLVETNQAVEVRLDVPGVEPKEIEVQLNGNVLTVSGQRKEEKEEKGKMYHRMERRAGMFSRAITLPCPVVEETIEAKYRDGVLTIIMPKTEDAKAKKIEVKT